MFYKVIKIDLFLKYLSSNEFSLLKVFTSSLKIDVILLLNTILFNIKSGNRLK